jgi:DNA-binding response OmpR family regulator
MPDRASILIVEDDSNLQEMIRLAGEKKSYRMLLAGNGLEAKAQISGGAVPNLIVLDITMPGMDGFGFCRWLREDYRLIPVIFLSARAEEYDKIIALEIGGDDYLTKPFSMKELFARIGVCLRRIEMLSDDTQARKESRPLILDNVKIDADSWTCEFKGTDVILTISEFRILLTLLQNPGIALTRDALADAAFPDDSYNLGRSIDVHICRIRRKLQGIDPGFDSIETVYQLGYKWKS